VIEDEIRRIVREELARAGLGQRVQVKQHAYIVGEASPENLRLALESAVLAVEDRQKRR